jgi:hypothetical protein
LFWPTSGICPRAFLKASSLHLLLIDTEAKERGYYFVPPYMATHLGDLVYQLPRKAFVAIESWVHIFIVDILFGVFARGVNEEAHIDRDWHIQTENPG